MNDRTGTEMLPWQQNFNHYFVCLVSFHLYGNFHLILSYNTRNQFFGIEYTKNAFKDAIFGLGQNQCLACRVSMLGNYYPKRFPGHSHFRILVFPHQQQIENYFKIL